jgi:hypothetical protein
VGADERRQAERALPALAAALARHGFASLELATYAPPGKRP